MIPLAKRYFCYKLLKAGYDAIYTKMVTNFIIEMIIYLFLEIIIVSISKIYMPILTKYIYAIYNYVSIFRMTRFLIKLFAIKEPIINLILIILFLRIFITNLFFDILFFILLIVYFYPRRVKIYYFSKQLVKIIVTNLNQKMKYLSLVYLILYIYSLFL